MVNCLPNEINKTAHASFIDLKKAFDTLDYSILLERLKNMKTEIA